MKSPLALGSPSRPRGNGPRARVSSPPGGSTLSTSAPRSQSSFPAYAAETPLPASTTRRPGSAAAACGSIDPRDLPRRQGEEETGERNQEIETRTRFTRFYFLVSRSSFLVLPRRLLQCDRIDGRADGAGDAQRRGHELELVHVVLGAVLAQRLEVPHLAQHHAHVADAEQ